MLLVAILAIQLVFAIRELSLASPDPLSLDVAENKVASGASANFLPKEASLIAKASLPQGENALAQPAGKAVNVMLTAYSSVPGETDDTPFVTASGGYVYSGVAAANFLSFGTRFKVPELFGEKIFTIEDRMHPRYNGQKVVDIWFPETATARNFGKQLAKIEILD